jgi:hypothetical protein
VKDGTCQQWSVPEGLSWYNVHWIFEDSDGTIWAGLLTGMARLKNNQIRNITRANGLFDDFIFAIVPDDYGYFWVDSMRGIFRVSRQSLNDFCDGKTDQVKCEAYDGLEAVKTVGKTDQEWVGCKTRDGRIWFPSSQGVVMIDPANLRVNPTPPLVYIRQVRVNGKELKDNKVSAFPHGKGDLEFQYKALSYIAPQKMQFRYQLEGYDHDWIELQIPRHRLQRRWRLECRRRFLRDRIAPEFLSNHLVLPGVRHAGDGRTLGGIRLESRTSKQASA